MAFRDQGVQLRTMETQRRGGAEERRVVTIKGLIKRVFKAIRLSWYRDTDVLDAGERTEGPLLQFFANSVMGQ